MAEPDLFLFLLQVCSFLQFRTLSEQVATLRNLITKLTESFLLDFVQTLTYFQF